jgi:predicted patatin/cPLA2 family phospholipase
VTSQPPGVIELLRSRLAGLSDDYVLALTVEGGGMRGVVSGGMLIALHDLGMTKLFDRMYGTSAGAINLAYYASGGTWDALSIYYDYLPHGFVNPRWLINRPRLNMNYVFEDVMVHRVPLNAEAIVTSAYDVRIVLSNATTSAAEIIKVGDVASELNKYLMAGSWLPILAGRPYMLHDNRYLDGGLLCADPLYAALSEGCTHVLMLTSTAEGATPRMPSVANLALEAILNRWGKGLGDSYTKSHARWTADQKHLVGGVTVELQGSSVLRLRPSSKGYNVRRLTLDRGVLLDGAREGYAAVWRTFGRPLDAACFAVTGGNTESRHRL